MDKQSGANESRRGFLRTLAVGAAGGIGIAAGVDLSPQSGRAATQSGMRCRLLGRTNVKVSQLGMGTNRLKGQEAVVKRALDLGVRYFDTAECYVDGNSEITLGKGLHGRRDEAFVATKWHTDGKTLAAELLASLDASLKRLAMDHVDLIQIHGAESVEQVNSDELMTAFTRARDAGKVRFNGVSMHENQVEVARAVIKSGRFDAMLISYNAFIGERVGPVLAEAAKAGVGTIIMKSLQPVHGANESEVFKGLSGNPYQRAIQWVLRNPSVSTVIVGMPTFDELEENYQAATTPVTKAELDEFHAAATMAAVGSCHLCGACTGQCPEGVKVAQIMRCLLYHDGYGETEHAAELYRDLPASVTAAACALCSMCRPVCPWGVPVRERMLRAHSLLAQGPRRDDVACHHASTIG